MPARVLSIALITLLLSTICLGPTTAQMPSPPDPEKLMAGFRSLVAFADKVRINEADVASVLANWESFQPIGEQVGMDTDPQGGAMDFEQALAHPDYVKWAKAHKLDPETWAPKMVRIGLLLQREAFAEMAPQMTEMMTMQKTALEGQREAMGEQRYQEMTRQMGLYQTQLESMLELTKAFEPTEDEAAAIEQHREALTGLFGAGAQ